MSKTNAFGLTSGELAAKTDAPAVSMQETQEPEEPQQAQTNGNAVQGEAPTLLVGSPYSYMGADFQVNLDEKLGKDLDRGKIVRYQLAPRENWGPMSRAK